VDKKTRYNCVGIGRLLRDPNQGIFQGTLYAEKKMRYHRATPCSHAFKSEELRASRELSEMVKWRKFKGTLGHYYKVLVSVTVDKEQEDKSPSCSSWQGLAEDDSS
jgi:hypothetical protein